MFIEHKCDKICVNRIDSYTCCHSCSQKLRCARMSSILCDIKTCGSYKGKGLTFVGVIMLVVILWAGVLMVIGSCIFPK